MKATHQLPNLSACLQNISFFSSDDSKVVGRSLVQTTVRATRQLSTIVMISPHKDRWVLFGPLHTIDPNFSRPGDPLPFSDGTSHRQCTHETCWHPNLHHPQDHLSANKYYECHCCRPRPTDTSTRLSKTLYDGATSLEHGWGGESTARPGGLHQRARPPSYAVCEQIKHGIRAC